MHFTPIRQLGVGGMAVATLARDEAGRLVVLKRSLAGRPSDDKALRDEGRLGQLLDHPALVKTLGVIEEDGHPCLVLEYIPGLSLQALRSCGPLAPPKPSARFTRLKMSRVITSGCFIAT